MNGRPDNQQEGRHTMRSQRSVMTAPRDALRRIVGCADCAGHQRPGYVREWTTDATSPHGMRAVWKRCPAECTAESRQDSVDRQLAARFGRPVGTAPAPAACAGTSEESAVAPAPVPVREAAPVRRPSTSRRPSSPRAAAHRPGPELVAAVAVDVVDDAGHLVLDVDGIGAPEKRTLDALFAWIGTGLPVGVEKQHKDGRRTDGALCLSAAACAALKLPANLPEGAALVKLETRLRKAAEKGGLSIGQTIGARMRVFGPANESRRRRVSLSLVVTPWLGQGDQDVNGVTALTETLATARVDGGPDARTLARRLRKFTAALGVPAMATSPRTGMELLDAVRPREEWSEDRTRVLRDGALPSGDVSVPVAAGTRHPVTKARTAARELICEEGDYRFWLRELTPQETGQPWAVAVDVCASYLSVTETLRLPSGALAHTTSPAWSNKAAGLWLCDFTALETETALPHPATYTGEAPTGPGWYATPTVDYMAREYGFDTATIGEAYVSAHTVPFLREWTTAIRGAYKGAMEAVGLVDGMDEAAFLAAYEGHKVTGGDADKDDALVLAVQYKSVYKGGIGKWADKGRQYPLGSGDADWAEKVAPRWWYRPEVRFHIVAAARIAAHRRMRKTYRLTGRAPFSVNVDSYLYASEAPSPLGWLPRTEDGRPVPGALRMGIAPGSFKHESSIPMAAAVDLIGEKLHPSRLTHEFTTAGTPVTTQEV